MIQTSLDGLGPGLSHPHLWMDAMRALRLGRGRRKAVKEFGVLDGLWMIAFVTIAMIAIVLLFLIGFFRSDVD